MPQPYGYFRNFGGAHPAAPMLAGVTVTDTPATYREVFSVPAYRVLFTSRTLAIAADTLRIVALSMLVFQSTGSAWLSAVTFGIGFLPQAVGGMLLGSLSDKLRPRRLITWGYLIECAAAIALAAFALPVWASLTLVGLVAAGTPIFGGASSRLIADVLHGDAYVLGRSVSSMASGGAQLIGLAFGGLAVAALGPKHALFVTAAAHLTSALIVRLGLPNFPAPPTAQPAITLAAPPTATPPGGEPVHLPSAQPTVQAATRVAGRRSVLRDSWRVNAGLLRDGVVRRLLLIQWLPSACIVGAEALIVAYSGARGFSAVATGVLLACSPVGMLIGDFVVGRFVRPSVRTRLAAPLICLLGLPVTLMVFDPPLAVIGALFAISGAGFAYPIGLQRAFVDAVPELTRGQAFGLLSMGLMTLQGIGPVVFGGVAQLSSAKWAMAAAGVATVASALLVSGRPGKPTPHGTHGDTPRT
jgi:MFS family permease